MFNPDKMTKGFTAFTVFIILVNLAVYTGIGFVLFKILQHFGII